MLINKVGKQVIVVIDKDEAGSKLIDEAIELDGPKFISEWADNINDIGDAVAKVWKIIYIVQHC